MAVIAASVLTCSTAVRVPDAVYVPLPLKT